MLVRRFDATIDYKDVSNWWSKQDWPVIPLESLSDSGFIVLNNETKIISTWVYKLENSPWSLMEWTVGNPEVSWEERNEGLNLLIDTAVEWAKISKSDYLLTMTKHDRLIEKLMNNKFEKADTEMTHLMRKL